MIEGSVVEGHGQPPQVAFAGDGLHDLEQRGQGVDDADQAAELASTSPT